MKQAPSKSSAALSNRPVRAPAWARKADMVLTFAGVLLVASGVDTQFGTGWAMIVSGALLIFLYLWSGK